MSFRLVSKSVTLNDLERRNGRYFALFQRSFVYDVAVGPKTTIRPTSVSESTLNTRTILKRSAQLFSDYLGKTK